MVAAIQTEGLTKRYGATEALVGLDLEVQPGEIFGFLGPNGAGKTTTIRVLLDLIRPTSGRASVLGSDCQEESHRVRSMIGYLPGDLRLYPGLTGRATIELIGGLRDRPVDWTRVTRLTGALDLDMDRRVGNYSKGTRQKLGVVLALLARPPVLLLDEPTSGLDPIVQHTVWTLLREEAGQGTTVFFSSHVMSEVDQTCHRVGILRAGRLVAVEAIAALKGHAIRHIEVSFAETPPPPDAFRLPNVRELRRDNATLEFEVTGEIDPLLKALARHRVLDLRTEQPTLDEVLLTFYREGGG